MEIDIVALSGLEWIYDRVKARYGTAAAWIVTMTLALLLIAALIAALVVVF